MAKKLVKSRNTRNTRNTGSTRSTKNVKRTGTPIFKVDPLVSLAVSLIGGAVFIIFMFLSIYTSAAGSAGLGFNIFLKSLFGDGLYYLPFVGVYLYYAVLVHKKNKDNLLKIISAVVLTLFISAGVHMTINNSDDYIPTLKNINSIIAGAQNSMNGGIFGTYIGNGLRGLVGSACANILIASINIAAIIIIFSKAFTLLVTKTVEFVKNREKTSKIFRIPGIKTETGNNQPTAQNQDELELPDFLIPENNDVVIERFSAAPQPEKAPVKPKEKEKEPALTKSEVSTIVSELENAKSAEVKQYLYPAMDFLNKPPERLGGMTKADLNNNAKKLIKTLSEFGVEAEIISIQEGPAVTRYEIRPQIGVKISKIMGLSDDIALRMAAKGIRIAPIPGKTVIGVEIANQKVMPVFVREVISSDEFFSHSSKVSFALGKDIAGTTIVGDIAKMPHCLIAGSTGSGKSVCVNSLITSILYKASPEEVKLIMIDPKVVELSVYNGIPHLLIPVVTDPRKAAGALNWAVMEMLNRYNLFAKANVRDLDSYNEVARSNGEDALPKIVIIVDELADLMVASPKEVEEYICRLAQLARAAGMHLVIATQRPSVDVITGLIKANIPSRIAFAVSSQIDSRTILDMAGAEKLLGKGDMLYAPIGESKPIRVQGALITDKEVERIVTFLKENVDVSYDDDVLSHIESAGGKDGPRPTDDSGEADDMLPQCIEFVVELGEASVSKLQRRFKLGYSRAARIVDQMEERGIVGPSEGSKPRQVLLNNEQYHEMMMSNPEYQ